MSGAVAAGGGWGDSSPTRQMMSPATLARVRAAEREDELQRVREEKQRKRLEEAREERAIRSAIELAVQSGQELDMGRILRGDVRQLGHTPAEFIEITSMLQDHEDALRQAADARAYRQWLNERSADASADASAPTEWEMLQAAKAQAAAEGRQQHTRDYRDRERLIEEARRRAGRDREVDARNARAERLYPGAGVGVRR